MGSIRELEQRSTAVIQLRPTGKNKIRPQDIRTPVDIDEAKTGLSLSEHMLKCLDAQAKSKAAMESAEKMQCIESLRFAWQQKCYELEYAIARFRAGEPPEDSRIEKLMKQVADLQRQNNDLIEKNKRLKVHREWSRDASDNNASNATIEGDK